MKKTFFKNLFRDIKKTFSRFLSIVIIIAIGVAFYAGVRATSPDMKRSGDLYLRKNNFMDFKLISTLGLTKDDVSEVEKLKGVKKVEGSFSIDAVIEKDKHSLVLNINSIPSENGINKMRIVEGRTAENDNEAVVEERFMKENKFSIGDEIELKSGKDSKIEEDLKNNQFKIVGSVQSPLYLSAQRQLSSVGNGSVKGFLYILPGVFKSEVYTEIYVKTNNKKSDDSLLYNQDYKKTTESIEKALKNIGIIRNEIRYTEVLKDAESKINTAEDKLSSLKKEAIDKFEDSYKQLDDAKNKIAEGKLELKKSQSLFNDKMLQSEKQIADGKVQIQVAENQVNSKINEIEKGKLKIADGKKQLEINKEKLNLGKQQSASNISSEVALKVDNAKKQLDSQPNNPTYNAQYNDLNWLYEKDIKDRDFEDMYNLLKADGALEQMKAYFDIVALKSSFDNAESEITLAAQQLSNQEKLIKDGEESLKAGIAKIELNTQKISDSEVKLNIAKKEGMAELSDGRKKLADKEKEIDVNIQKLKSEEEKVNSQVKDGEVEIQKNKDKINDIKEPQWYVLGRSANVGYETYRQDSDRIDNIGKAFPLIFFLVAALVSLTTMTRMVQENRVEIGTFKALGYSRMSIVAHYLIYALAASATGSILGVSFGFKLFPPLIMNAYASLYTIPESLAPFDLSSALQASALAILLTTIAAVAATLEELREAPSSLMRPKPPKSGKTILLERIPFIWGRLSFTKKVTARNIFRYKQRFFMTVIGIATCTGLMITGFGLKSGIIGAAEGQFSKIYRYDMQSILKKDIDADKKNILKNKIMEDTNVKSVLFAYTKNGTVNTYKPGTEDVYVVVTEDKDELNKYINLTMNGKELKLGEDGVIITQKLSKLMNKKIGDTASVTLNGKIVEAKISGITEHYVQHYIYMSSKYYKKLTNEQLKYNGFYGLLNSTSSSSLDSTSKILMKIQDVGSVSYKKNTHFDFNKTIKSLNSVVLILVISAGVLAFVVIYNLTNININERKRELATIKLLGFYNKELALYIYRENIILTIIGSLTGIPVGIILTNFVINTAETNVMMFLKKINPIYFIYAVIITISFSVVVNLAMYREFDKIDMIESLKSAE